MFTCFSKTVHRHIALITVELLRRETPEGPDFIPSDRWSPNSPDVNAVDYRICGSLQQHVYRHQWRACAHELRQRLMNTRAEYKQTATVDETVD